MCAGSVHLPSGRYSVYKTSAAMSKGEKQRQWRFLVVEIRKDTATDPLWFKDAVIYQLQHQVVLRQHADGYGDFPGLIEKLDIFRISVSTASGSCHFIHRRSGMMDTTLPTTKR